VTGPRKLFDTLAAQRRFVFLAVALLSAAGVWTASRLPSAIYPELTFPRITIVVQGSSLGARQIVFSITRPIEEAVSIVPGVTRVRSRSIRGAAEVNVTMAGGIDMAYALQLVQARMNEVRADLPPELDIIVERQTPSLFPILSYNLTGGDPATLYDLARYQIKPVLSRVPGVGRVDVEGSDVREVEVVAEPARLAQQNLTFEDLAAIIKRSTTVSAAGRLPRDYRQYLIVTAHEAHSVDDIANIVVANGLRVRDVATVTLGSEDRVRLISGDAKPVAQISVTRQIGGNSVAIADSIAGVVRALGSSLPPGVRFKLVYDQAALVRDATSSVRDAMLIGAALAVLVLLVFLRHVRITIISASAIPLTLVISVLIMGAVGQTFNLMTLGAMAIAIGLVIDDAVVITENIVRHLQLTPDRTQAVREAVQEIIWPVTTSTLTTVVVFLPLRLLQGVAGQFFAALSITLTIAVLVSLVLALSIIPLLAAQFLRTGDAGERDRQPGQAGALGRVGRSIDALSVAYGRWLALALHRVRWVVAGAVVLLLGGVLLQRVTETGFLPDMDEGAFVLDYFTPGGTALNETDRQLREVERILAETPEVEGTSRRTGAELGLFATAQNTGDIVARLTPPSQRDRSLFEVIDDIRVRIEESHPRLRIEFVQILTDVINDLAGVESPVEIKLFGQDMAALEKYGTELAEKLEGVDGLEDVYNGVSEPGAELLMHVKLAEANRLGLAPEDVTNAVSGALLGVEAGEVRLDDRALNVRVRAPDSVRFNAQLLGTLPILAPATRSAAPLASLATFEPTETRAELFRENQQQMISVTADVSGRGLGAVMADVRATLAETPPPPSIRYELGGLYAPQQEAFRALMLVLALAAASVVAVMVVQFQSFVEPLVILVAAPLSFVGSLALLRLTGTALNVSSFMGLILLVGLIVKNGIILLDFTRRRMRESALSLESALEEAAQVRLRPILMTTLCTLFGLLPLALGLGTGSELQRPLALAVIGGLALSTPVTLFVVPTLLVAIRGRAYRLAR
jgi:CzcA family heavy metal efflux pump